MSIRMKRIGAMIMSVSVGFAAGFAGGAWAAGALGAKTSASLVARGNEVAARVVHEAVGRLLDVLSVTKGRAG